MQIFYEYLRAIFEIYFIQNNSKNWNKFQFRDVCHVCQLKLLKIYHLFFWLFNNFKGINIGNFNFSLLSPLTACVWISDACFILRSVQIFYLIVSKIDALSFYKFNEILIGSIVYLMKTYKKFFLTMTRKNKRQNMMHVYAPL